MVMLPVVIPPSPNGEIAPIGLFNGTLSGAVWSMAVTDVAVLRFSVASSGNSVPLTTVQVDWGDGTIDLTDFRPVGRQFQYTHQYVEPGSYAIAVQAANTDGEKSVLNVTEISLSENRGSVVAPTNRWRGLGLPDGTIRQSVATIQQNNAPLTVGLAAQALVNQNVIVVDSTPEAFVPQAQVTITQPGKLISTGRVISTDFNIITLDSQLNDTYDVGPSNVEVRSSIFTTSMMRRTSTDIPWAYPSIVDSQLVKAAIRMILGTQPMERVMLPTFGSDLHRIPFEQNDTITQSLVRKAVVDAVQNWEPRATASNFTITSDNNDLNVSVTFVLSNDPSASFDVNFSLNAR